MLIRNRESDGKGGRWELSVSDAIRYDLNGTALSVADSFIASVAVAHHTWKLHGLGDPPAVFFPIQINRQVHCSSISRAEP